MLCKVLKQGISLESDGKWRSPRIGERLELSDAAAHHLISEGYVEPVSDSPKKGKEESE